jgi:poly-beta-hydroxyalkanoate depolymerase
VAFLAVEGAIDDIAGIGQRCGELAIKVGVVLDHEEAQGTILQSRAGMVLAVYGVNGNVNHFATAAKQSQYIHEFLVLPT